MVGGAISGYCAIGSVESAITPTSVITMLITPAKIGRSMKKWGKFMPTAIAAASSFPVLRLSRRFLRVRSAGGAVLPHRRDFHSGLQQLQTRRDNLLAVFQPVFHNPFSFENTSGLEVAPFDGAIGFHHEGVFQPLLRTDHFVRDQRAPIRRRGGNAHTNKKTRRDEIRVPVF